MNEIFIPVRPRPTTQAAHYYLSANVLKASEDKTYPGAIVASLALAWGLGEVTGYKHSLEHHPLEARWFYAVYAVTVVGSAILIGVAPNLVSLNVGVQVMNAFLLPLVLGFLVALAIKALPPEHRLRGVYLWVVVIVATITCLLGVFGGLNGAGIA